MRTADLLWNLTFADIVEGIRVRFMRECTRAACGKRGSTRKPMRSVSTALPMTQRYFQF
jgi:hypothetical protein